MLVDSNHVQGGNTKNPNVYNLNIDNSFIDRINYRIQLYVGKREDVSHNFLSELLMTPEMYVRTQKMTSPVAPFSYNGQKKESLAVAIKWLTYQSGKYKGFLDLFGGTSSATMAVPHYDTSLYLYNEKNVFLYNLIKVIADDKLYKELINRFDKLLNAIREDDDFLSVNDYTDVDSVTGEKLTPDEKLTKEVIEYFNYSRIRERSDNEKLIVDFDGYGYDYEAIVEFFKLFFIPCIDNILATYPNSQIIKIDERDFDRDYLYNLDSYISFIKNYDDIVYIASAMNLPFIGKKKKYLSDGNEVQEEVWQYYLNDKEYSFQQYRLYRYYAYFANLRKNAHQITGVTVIPVGKEIEFAVGELLRNNLLTNTNADISAVLRMRNDMSSDAIRLLNKEKSYFKDIITNMHNNLSVVRFYNEDYSSFFKAEYVTKRAFFKNYTRKINNAIRLTDYNNMLVYSDSPYIATSGYVDGDANVDKFTSEDMSYLVDQLDEIGVFENVNDLFRAASYVIKDGIVTYYVPGKLPKGKCIILSATLDVDMYKKYFRLSDHDIHYIEDYLVRYKGKVIQFNALPIGRGKLDESETWSKLLNTAKEYVDIDTPVITFKKYQNEENINSSLKPNIANGFYISKCLGSNGLKGRNIIIAGTPYMEDKSYELIGAYLTGRVLDSAKFRSRIAYGGYEFFHFTYMDYTLQNLQCYWMKGELEQAVGRARIIQYDKTVVVFASVPCEQATYISRSYMFDDENTVDVA